jgi:hypothetical protein
MSTLPRLVLATDASPGDWVTLRVGPFASGVGSLVPHGFEAYARILHPATDRSGAPVLWATIAGWSGWKLHPLVQFHGFVQPRPGSGEQPRPYDAPPPDGNLPGPVLAALCQVLASHTGTSHRCWFCLWDGYGGIDGGAAMLDSSGGGTPLPPAFGPASVHGPRVRLPERNYLLFEGPLEAAPEMGWRPGGQWFVPQSPNLFWPADKAWCVATEIDLDSTYVGGSAALIAAILADERLEAFPAEVTDDVTAGSDDVNR